ncbi:succinylglutamate desuccinylase/aspartoacylase family protein [Serratia sp. UGAL515B_01]|uniref:M14 family metallopeptidase n=1 Tax=Serratia sp. UGAL515B_01 TaxID=2986763 RepID=UPI002952FCD6|nr:succinylglutamate desuccinylase/aspartoacylase family protein [Serratia sp. UGAL515B_01]WON75595.1 succinylglutamate desuccinylase/aspartoacylase family protein [Serratia sp. UGAL515B_01]
MYKVTMFAVLLAGALNVQAATVYTGDKIDGNPVISKLDVDDLEAGKVYRFMFQGASNGIGQHWYVPVLVAKGAKTGPKLGLQAAIHGDELNGTRVIQQVFEKLDPTRLKGSVVGVVGANPSGMLANNRNWQLANDGGYMVDFNRIWPGKEKGNTAEQHAWLLWNNLWAGNAAMFVDMHTQSTGTEYPLFIYADYSNAQVKQMAELFPADQIKADPGEKGSVETTFVENKIPAITLEIGQPKLYQPELIARSLVGVNNLMIQQGMIEGELGATAKEQKTFVGNEMDSIRAEVGGFSEILVKVGDSVVKGQKVAIQRNAFGDTLREYTASHDGKVLAIGNDPLREPRALLVRILFNNPAPQCVNGC